MPYSKELWKDRVSAFLDRIRLTLISGTDIFEVNVNDGAQGAVSENGTLVNEPIMNNIESGVFDAHKTIGRSSSVGGLTGATLTNLLLNADSTAAYFAEQLNINGGSYTTNTYGFAAQSTSFYHLRWKPDGTKAYIATYSSGTIYAYDAGTAFDVSTLVYNGESKGVSAQDIKARDVSFSPDGLIMYMQGGDVTDTIFQYDLSVAWDVSSATYASKSFVVSAITTAPAIGKISPDGFSYFVASQGSTIYQLNLTTAFDISTAFNTGKTLVVNTIVGTMVGFDFDSTGLNLLVQGTSVNYIARYRLALPWELDTAVNTADYYNPTAETATSMRGISWGEGYNKFYSVSLGDCYEYDVSGTLTGTLTKDYSIGSGIAWSDIRCDIDTLAEAFVNATILQNKLATAVATGSIFNIDSEITVPDNLGIVKGGTKIYISSFSLYLYEYTLTTPYDITTAVYTGYRGVIDSTAGMHIDELGTYLFITGGATQELTKYTMISPYRVESMVQDGSAEIISEDTHITQVWFNSAGTKAFIYGQTNKTIYQYTLGTAWDITTISYDSKSKLVSAEIVTSSIGMTFNADMTRLLLVGTDKIVYQYTLSTAGDISTATYDTINFDVSADLNSVWHLCFDVLGNYIYAVQQAVSLAMEVVQFDITDGRVGGYISGDVLVAEQNLELGTNLIDITSVDAAYNTDIQLKLEIGLDKFGATSPIVSDVSASFLTLPSSGGGGSIETYIETLTLGADSASWLIDFTGYDSTYDAFKLQFEFKAVVGNASYLQGLLNGLAASYNFESIYFNTSGYNVFHQIGTPVAYLTNQNAASTGTLFNGDFVIKKPTPLFDQVTWRLRCETDGYKNNKGAGSNSTASQTLDNFSFNYSADSILAGSNIKVVGIKY